jgi:nucleotide-binding universal stress UspA family protein
MADEHLGQARQLLSAALGQGRRIGIQAETDAGHEGDPVEAVKRGASDAGVEVIALGSRARLRWRLSNMCSFLGRLLGRISRPLLVP